MNTILERQCEPSNITKGCQFDISELVFLRDCFTDELYAKRVVFVKILKKMN
jgi:hypothetical protein